MDLGDKLNILVDIDGTVSEDINNEDWEKFENAYVLDGAVEGVNSLYEKGHIITFFTARKEEHREITKRWLDKNGFKYSGNLLMNKPRGGSYVWIDNLKVEGVKYNGNWGEVIHKCNP